VRTALAAFIPFAAVSALVCYILICANGWAWPPIRSDGWSYHVYLPAWFIFHDPTLEAIARDCCGGIFPTFTAIDRWPGTGAWLDVHPPGTAILSAPFFAVAHLLTRWSNLSRDGFSLYYQHGAALAGVTYLIGGLIALKRALLGWFSPGVVLATLVAVTWGTDLFHYGTYDPTFSHVYAFALTSLLLLIVPRWFDAPSMGRSVLLGAVVALVILVRHVNVLIIVGFACYGLNSAAAIRRRLSWITEHAHEVVTTAVTSVLLLAPLVMFYRRSTGHWLASPYGATRTFDFTSPHLFGVLFSSTKGLFFWSPVLLVAVAGFFLLRRRLPEMIAPIVILLPPFVYLVSSWFDWQFGASFGHRAFVDVLPFFAVGLAACFDRVKGTRASIAVAAVVCVAVALSVAQMIKYWIGVLPQHDTTWGQYVDVFLRFSR
jgi:hypothetical protein